MSAPGNILFKPILAEKIKVLVVDDHQLIRDSLRRLIEDEPELEVVAEAPNGRIAVEVSKEVRPDVIVMDINMPEMNGLEATKRISSELPEAKIIALSLINDEATMFAMRNAGAVAYLTKDVAFETLCQTIREVANEYNGEHV